MIRKCSRSLLASASTFAPSASSLFCTRRLGFTASGQTQKPSPRKTQHDLNAKNNESLNFTLNNNIQETPNTSQAIWSESRLQRVGGFGNEHKAGFLAAATLLFLLNVITRLSLQGHESYKTYAKQA